MYGQLFIIIIAVVTQHIKSVALLQLVKLVVGLMMAG